VLAMWIPGLILSVLLSFAAGWGGARLALWHFNRRLRDCQYDIAAVDDRLLREVKKRAAEERWSKEPAAPPADVDEAVKEIRGLVVGTVDEKGFLHGKEGGVRRGVL